MIAHIIALTFSSGLALAYAPLKHLPVITALIAAPGIALNMGYLKTFWTLTVASLVVCGVNHG